MTVLVYVVLGLALAATLGPFIYLLAQDAVWRRRDRRRHRSRDRPIDLHPRKRP